MMWRRIQADDREWEVRATADVEGGGGESGRELLEFRCLQGDRSPRRLSIPAGALQKMDDEALLASYRQALPIGGDHYGRPGKRMGDANL